MSDSEIRRRAFAGFFRFSGSGHPTHDRQHDIDGVKYITIHDSTEHVLATYRVRNDGKLRQIKELPQLELI